MDWFNEARFGMFLHFGVYSLIGRGEWAVNRERIPFEEYEEYAKKFNPVNYNPREWAKIAKKAGMKYMVLTTRHHDGFALFDSKVNKFNSVNYGPKRDLVKEYVEAVRAEGLKVGLYYSPANWYHPDYPGAYYRDWARVWENEEQKKRYVEYYTAEIRELMTNYGKIDLLWYDGCAPHDLDGAITNEMVRRLQPGILLNKRLDPTGDFACSEQKIVKPDEKSLWEACITMNDAWAYCYDDNNYKSLLDLVKILATTAAGGGNLLLNVGPKPDGTLPEQAIERLEKIGEWMSVNGEAIYNSEAHNYPWLVGQSLTKKGGTIYLHSFRVSPVICLADFTNKVLSVTKLKNNKPMKFRQDGVRLFIETEETSAYESGSIVFKIELEGEPQLATYVTTSNIPDLNGEIEDM